MAITIEFIENRILSNLRETPTEHQISSLEAEIEAAQRSFAFWGAQKEKYVREGKPGMASAAGRKRDQALLWEHFARDLISALTPALPAPLPLSGDALRNEVALRYGISRALLDEERSLEEKYMD